MDFDLLAALPVYQLAKENSVLFLWTTGPQLDIAVKLIQTWGFNYKTFGFVWTKTTKNGRLFMGGGFYTRSNSEICLLATKGRRIQVADRSIRNCVLSPIGTHSSKPVLIYDLIERLYPVQTKIELFARTMRSGWATWGNQIDSDINLFAAMLSENLCKKIANRC